MRKVGLVLTGGGARGAYQAGALRAINDIIADMDNPHPFQILTGTSAGAINVGFLASHGEQFSASTQTLQYLWESMTTEKVFKIDLKTLIKIASHWVWDLSTGSFNKTKMARALLDTEPLYHLIHREFNPVGIHNNLQQGFLDSVAITAVNYATGSSRTFFQGKGTPWQRNRRSGESVVLTPKHIMASAALPLLFPPVQLADNDYYGDGSLRNYTPLSPAIHLGAEKLMVIGVRRDDGDAPIVGDHFPSVARMLSVVLNSILLDAIDLDFERMSRINTTLSKLPDQTNTSLRPIDVCMLRPSEDLGRMATLDSKKMPATIRYLVRGLGSTHEASDLISYLLFEPEFIDKLIQLGYQDTLKKADEIRTFFSE
ncbi:MAG: patatin-like phospholipase family protein [Candidatus Margulisiibacteriota bacterium]